MQVMIPLNQHHHQNMDFDFTSAFTTPYSTAPSTPKRFGQLPYANSAPTSPSRGRYAFYNDDQDEFHHDEVFNGFQSEEISKEDEFAFEFSEASENTSLSADELFDGGKIKSLGNKSPESATTQGKKKTRYGFARKQKSKQIDDTESTQENTIGNWGRDYYTFQTALNSGRQSVHHQTLDTNKSTKQSTIKSASASSSLSPSPSKSKGWSLKDFFLFRSASEGRASDKDPLKKYYSFFTSKKHESVKKSSFQSSPDSGSVSKRRASAHEMHYNTNRAAAEESRKKTPLSYKQGILGKYL